MRQWEIPEPSVADANKVFDGRNWFVNSQGVTLVRISPPPVKYQPIPDPLDTWRIYLSKEGNDTSEKEIEPGDRFLRGKARYLLGDFEQSIAEFNTLLQLEDDWGEAWRETLNEAERLRLFSLAKLKRAKEIDGAMSLYRESNKNSVYNLGTAIRFLLHPDRLENSDAAFNDYVHSVVPLWLGRKEEAVDRLNLSLSSTDSMDLARVYNLARSFALFAAHESATAEEKQSWIDQAIKLLERWSPDDEMSRTKIREEPDFILLHQDIRFLALAAEILIPVKPYWVANREVTRGEFEAFLDDTSYDGEKPKDAQQARPVQEVSPTLDHPAQNMSWYDAVMYCNWLSRREGRTPAYRIAGKQKLKNYRDQEVEVDKWEQVEGANGYRLPRELEWEYACRAGSDTSWSTGSDESLLAPYCQMFPSKLASPCGRKLPNAWGLHDMHGNVWEWCWDLYDSEGSSREYRGGSWSIDAAGCGSAPRYWNTPVNRRLNFGFRLALSSPSGIPK
jgi:tetratricopeptide (TPR) repeat protein